MAGKTIKAKVDYRGELAVVETELGQRAVIPKDKLCELAARFNLEYININIDCKSTSETGERYLEIEYE
jgi:hypothetical protein